MLSFSSLAIDSANALSAGFYPFFTKLKTAANPKRFLRHLNRIYPIAINILVLIDNNKEFTEYFAI